MNYLKHYSYYEAKSSDCHVMKKSKNKVEIRCFKKYSYNDKQTISSYNINYYLKF